MFVGLFTVLIPVLCGAGLAWGLSRRPVEVLDQDDRDLVCRLRRRAQVSLLVGLVAGTAVAIGTTWALPGPGVGAAIAPLVGASVLLLCLCVAELTTPHVRSSVRTASLGTRRLGDVLDARSRAAAAAGVGLLATLLAIGWLLGDPDGLGRAGRTLATQCGSFAQARGPWPGSFYAVPMLLALVVVVVTAVATLLAITRRARTSAATVAGDDAVRRAAGRRVLLTTAAVTLFSSVPVGLLMASALLALDCRPDWYPVLGTVLLAVCALAGLVGAACFGSAVVGPRIVVRQDTTTTASR
ncbi:hypothetical protein ASG88_08150 [Nocardioides sp. Soil777]|uniref:hypothetical protein n=1 Tax=Nocardioides sp. Soil777 TaxID=1736409 RepID=UPI000702D15F|nr:hypothetical protein [Nocardioides sp. Soil777]KRF01435.1 hypothetical protein ASG88_08150 [Nocardioides sp. Soil777]